MGQLLHVFGVALMLVSLLLGPAGATANNQRELAVDVDDDLIDRPISAIRILGLVRVEETLVVHNIRSAVGDPYDPMIVREDVSRLSQLGLFRLVTASAQLRPPPDNDGTVVLTFTVAEQPLITEVQTVGNTLISDQDLRAAIGIPRGAPRDEFQIQRAQRSIEQAYRGRGHFLAAVFVDESELDEHGILLFRIVEGPRIRIRAIEFVGNVSFPSRELMPQIQTRTAMILFRRGELDEEQLQDDVAALDRFYRDRGYLDVRVDRQVQISPDEREAKVVFMIAEGPQYRLRTIRAERVGERPLEVFTAEQLAAMLDIRPGDVWSGDRLRRSVAIVGDAYGRLGRVGAGVVQTEPFRVLAADETAEVDLVLVIDEGREAVVGLVEIQGNFLTQDRVIRREMRLQPGRPLDATEIDRSTRRIRDTRHFNDVRITPLEPRDDDPLVRDILVEVKERNTGSMNFGAAFGTDTGFFGEISLTQTNFDLFDFPDSFGEWISGRAFRGAGQTFHTVFRPGNEIFEYAMSVSEPRLFDSEYSLSASGSFFQRIYREYDEQRITGSLALGRRLGDVWSVALRGRGEHVELSNIFAGAPVDIFQAAGPDLLTAIGVTLSRNTFTTITRPGRGSSLNLSFDRFGAMGGDWHFNRVSAEHTFVLTVDEDFLGRPSTLRFTTEVGYIFGGNAPVYERFYRGGRTFRGLRFREVSPKGVTAAGVQTDFAVGGEWMFFFGPQYEFPIFGEAITGVFFVDTGTVTSSPGFSDYRVSVGTGIRLYIPQFGPVPIAIDFGFPVVKRAGDREQMISFSVELPFN